ncbi:hemolysin XhlA family protein [Gracilibacillus alcaliphilus]|uniref:hemolysin XhlA family protein n=1 Tax=Gracilibacillus alcaliphilus TaxID=1401441 RepID=UPI0019572528|nr:hemolysin XhlA family protein [Gracilibacillus alcaliphilus]MBM7678369.1 septal ring factor EnvC (AmiA/AmiB activator) [Gracilibacillus alcaliphilus]
MTKNEEMGDMDAWKERMQQDVSELKSNYHLMKKDVEDLQRNDIRQDSQIESMQEKLNAIQDDTNWIRRKITGAFITALVTAIVAGIVGIAISNIF